MKERENENTITTKEALNAIYRNGKRRVKKFFKKYGKYILVGTGAGALGYFVYTSSGKRRYYIDKQHINNPGVIEGDLNLVDVAEEFTDEEDDEDEDEDEE